MNQDYHIFQGMRQDNPPIRQEAKFLWDAYNIRLTNRGDNSIFSISNEKGNTNILTLDDYYVGHCVIGEYLIIFTVVKGTLAPEVKRKTNIYRIDKKTRLIISRNIIDCALGICSPSGAIYFDEIKNISPLQ